jgi:signal transduction histidine kinase
LAEGLAGLRLARYHVPGQAWIVRECLDQQQPVFSRDLPRVLATMLPEVAGGVAGQLTALFGKDADFAVLYLPLMVEDQVLGLLALWGTSLEPDDVPAYSMFASQVAVALRNAQLVAHLDQARREAEEANRLKSLFLANVSHELRTPLTGILGSLDLVLGEVCETPAEARQFLGLAREAGQRLLRLINDLLDLARIEAGHLHMDLQVLDLAPVVAEASGLCRPAAEAKRLQLRLALPPAGPLLVWADPDRLTQIILNLVGNAIKFTESGEVRVAAVADPQAGQVEIRVEDTGIGIAPALQAQLFQPFVQADSSSTRKYGGTGLGLAISRRLAELMQGGLTLHSDGLGTGSTFRLSLPLADPRVGPPDGRPAERKELGA